LLKGIDGNLQHSKKEIKKKLCFVNSGKKGEASTIMVFNELHDLFYKGSKVLTQEITNLNNLLNETKNLTLEYNNILEQASPASIVTKSPIIFAYLGLLFGLFFSFIIICVKKLF
jgi:phosphoglycerate-specific signal transduction histidine kinase